MNRREREIRSLIADAGGVVVSLTIKNNGHYKARVQRPDKSEFNYTLPFSPSCTRWLLNARAQLRRLLTQSPRQASEETV